MKTVCFVANSGFTLINFRVELVKKFVREGWLVIAVIPQSCPLISTEEAKSLFDKLGVVVEYISLNRSGVNPLSDLKLYFEIVSLFEKHEPDLVLNYTIKPVIYSSIAAWKCKVKVVASNITGLGYVFTGSSLRRRLLSFFVKLQYRFALKFNSVIFFQNEDDKNLFVTSRLVDAFKTAVLNGSGVDTQYFVSSGKINNPMSFLFVGRLLKDKGVFEYINAAKEIKSNYSDIVFSIAGSLDSNPASLSAEALDDFIKAGAVNYLGTLKGKQAMKAAYDEHSVFVLPSYREGTPRSSLEALSMGMPIITTDVPGCRETVRDGWNGFLVEPKSTESLKNAMLRMIELSSDSEIFGVNGRSLAVSKFDVNSVNSVILDSLADVGVDV